MTPNTSNSDTFHLKYRPRTLDQIIGHTQAVKTLQGFVETGKIPNALFFTGNTSSGKTTLARAFAASMCGVDTIEGNTDVKEINLSDKRSIEDIRALIGLARLRPRVLKKRIIIGNEVQGLLANAPAANALLDPLEHPPKSTVWLLTSMEPDKFQGSTLGRALLNRCEQIRLKAHTEKDLYDQAVRIVKGEKLRCFSRETLEHLAATPGLEMRTLANTLQGISGQFGTTDKKITKLELDLAIAEGTTAENEIDVVVIKWLICLYENKIASALKELLAVDDVFAFLMRAQTLNRAVLFNMVLNGAFHKKVWVTKPAQALSNHMKEKAPDAKARKAVIEQMSKAHHAITEARQQLTFDLDGVIKLTYAILR